LRDQRGVDAVHEYRGRHLFFKENLCHNARQYRKFLEQVLVKTYKGRVRA
jgi:hypothetical protein